MGCVRVAVACRWDFSEPESPDWLRGALGGANSGRGFEEDASKQLRLQNAGLQVTTLTPLRTLPCQHPSLALIISIFSSQQLPSCPNKVDQVRKYTCVPGTHKSYPRQSFRSDRAQISTARV